MLVKKERTSLEDYIRLFDKKFSNFCAKNILTLGFSIQHDTVTIYDESGLMEEDIHYQIDLNVPIQTAIHDIREELSKYYPKFYTYREKTFSIDEIGELLKTHTPEEISQMESKRERVLETTIFRVLNIHNEINVIDHLDEGIKKVYKLKIPAMEFIHLLYTDIEEAHRVFKTKAKWIRGL